jgi:hypothetical protein
MSGPGEIKVVDAKQVVAKPSPDAANSNPSGSSEAAKNNGSCPAIRRRLPDEQHSLTHHFSIGGQEGYVTVGLYEDGAPGEMFIRMARKDRRFPGSWTRSPRPCHSRCNTVSR